MKITIYGWSIRALRVPAGPPAAPLDPTVVQAARRHRSPGAGEEQRPTSRQEARTVADQTWDPHPRRHLLTSTR
ncbi:MAG TPA: hypothetical protein VL330_09240, partial [Actinomycetes bacterium]|nr:hypothetical protein [Actinomycetes bacterium]